MLIDLYDFVANIYIDAGIGLSFLDDPQRDLKGITWGDSYFMCEESIKKSLIKYWCRNLDSSPKKLPSTLPSLQNCPRYFHLCDLENFSRRLIDRSFILEDRKFISRYEKARLRRFAFLY